MYAEKRKDSFIGKMLTSRWDSALYSLYRDYFRDYKEITESEYNHFLSYKVELMI